jgi:hypothetical protein
MSDKPKHTPGPWEWCETKTGLYGPDYPIIDTDRDWGMFLHPTNLESNAHLMAAAPDMLEVLEEIANTDLTGADDTCARFIFIALQHKALRAIAKAKP